MHFVPTQQFFFIIIIISIEKEISHRRFNLDVLRVKKKRPLHFGVIPELICAIFYVITKENQFERQSHSIDYKYIFDNKGCKVRY